MVPVYRYLEIAVYAMLNFLPFLFLVLYPFWDSLRFSKAFTCILIGLLTLIQIGLGISAALLIPQNAGLLSLLSTVTYLLFYFIAVSDHTGLKAFFLLIISNIANLAVVSSKFIEGRFFYELAQQRYRYTNSICMFLIELVICIPLFFYIKNISYLFKNPHTPKNIWKYLWLVPATFYLIWYYHLYSSNLSSMELAMRADHLLWLITINAGAMLIYSIIFKMIGEMEKNRKLSETNRALEIQKIQYHALDRRIQASRQARHDLRHHLHMMSAYLKDQKYDELQDYLMRYQSAYANDTPLFFCKNYTVNALLSYYAQTASYNGIHFEASAELPENVGISDIDLTVLLSNLLENAFEACRELKSQDAFIRFKGKMDGNLFFIHIQNSNTKSLKADGHNGFYSTKHKGTGLGTASARDIVNRYHGKIQFQDEGSVFSVSLLLIPKDGDVVS